MNAVSVGIFMYIQAKDMFSFRVSDLIDGRLTSSISLIHLSMPSKDHLFVMS